MLAESNAGIIILINKWDLITKDTHTMHEYEQKIRHDLGFLPYAPVLFISAETGQRVNRVLELAIEVNERRYQRIATGTLNKFLRAVTTQHPPPSKGGVRVKFFYLTQPDVAPPTFVFFVNKPKWVHFGYQRYLENRLREEFPLEGTPIRLVFRARSEERFGA
jgi:GTP-binding protein